MSQMFGVDLDQRRARADLPHFDPADDDFHDEELTDRWWETETMWFSWNIPERGLGGWTYCQARPNANLCNGGAWVWDDSAAYPWELLYRAEYSGLQLPPRTERDMRDFEWPNGVQSGCSSHCTATPSPIRTRGRWRWTWNSRRSWSRTRTPMASCPS